VPAALTAALLAAAAWRLVDVHDAKPRHAVVPSRSAVLGTWEPDGAGGRVEFTADGRFSAVDLPVRTSPGGEFTGAGSWSLGDRGGVVTLTPDDPPAGMNPQPGLAVVRADGDVRLCVTSGSPGVLCDQLLRLAAAPRRAAPQRKPRKSDRQPRPGLSLVGRPTGPSPRHPGGGATLSVDAGCPCSGCGRGRTGPHGPES
jgi:hypothetical protein